MKKNTHICQLRPIKQRLVLFLAAVLLIAGTFAGCSKKSDQKTKTNDEEKETEITEPTPTETPTEKPEVSEKDEKDKVISPNTIYDSEEDSDSTSASDNPADSNQSDSNTASNATPTPTPTPTSKPVVDPETAPELEPDHVELTAELADEMIPLFDSMSLAVSLYGTDNYDPASTDYVWSSLYLAIVNYADEGKNGISYSEDYFYKYAPASVVLEYASSMFAGMTKLPAIPVSQSSHTVYLSDKDYYQFLSSDRGASFTVVTGITAEDGGTYLVDTSMRTHSDEGTYVVHGDYTFRVEPNTSDSSGAVLDHPYVITEIVKVTTYENKIISE